LHRHFSTELLLASELLLGGHKEHAVAAVIAYVPTGQLKHSADPRAFLYVPPEIAREVRIAYLSCFGTDFARQILFHSCKLLQGQIPEQCAQAAPSDKVAPALHLHSMLFASEWLPSGHVVHEVEATAAYVPCVHTSHFPAPTDALNFPPGNMCQSCQD